MEDVLEVYTRPYDPQRPQVCIEETSQHLVVGNPRPAPGVLRAASARRSRG